VKPIKDAININIIGPIVLSLLPRRMREARTFLSSRGAKLEEG